MSDRTRSGSQPHKALAFLARLASEFTIVLSISELLDRTLNLIGEEVGFDSCTVGLLDEPPKDSLTLVAAVGLRREYTGLVIPHGPSLNWAVVESMQPMYVPDMYADPRVYRQYEGIRSGIYAPLISRGRVIGVLSAHRSEIAAFGPEDLDVLTVVARYLAGALDVARLHEQVRELATKDALTGLLNRRSVMDRLAEEISRGNRHGGRLGVAIVDLDELKQINDTHGHLAGDAVLVEVARALGREIRAHDIVGRLAGDEFILIFPSTDQAEAAMVVDRLRMTEAVVPGVPRAIPAMLCWGLATWPDEGDTVDELLAVADRRLYAMKKEHSTRHGRMKHGAPDVITGTASDDHPADPAEAW